MGLYQGGVNWENPIGTTLDLRQSRPWEPKPRLALCRTRR